jgi:hypothetical protein
LPARYQMPAFTLALGHCERKVTDMSTANLNEQLWITVLESADPLKIDPSCQLFLQAWIDNGVERMRNESRIAPEDVATAKANLKTFVELMKAEPLAHGTDRLDNKCFRAAQHTLERHSFLTVYSLWPFWPHAVSG